MHLDDESAGTNGTYFVRREGSPCWLPEISADGERLLTLVEEEGSPVVSSSSSSSPLHVIRPLATSHDGLFVFRVEGMVSVPLS